MNFVYATSTADGNKFLEVPGYNWCQKQTKTTSNGDVPLTEKPPRPSTKTVKIADNETGSSSGACSSLVDKMTVIAEAVQELQEGQQSLHSMVESKLDKLKYEFLSNIDNKFKAMNSDEVVYRPWAWYT